MASVRAVLVVFHLPEGSPVAKHRALRRAVYGEDTSSHGGRYRYRRRGVLDEVRHVRLYWGAVIVKKEEWPRVRRVLDEWGVVHHHRVVEPTAADETALAGAVG